MPRRSAASSILFWVLRWIFTCLLDPEVPQQANLTPWIEEEDEKVQLEDAEVALEQKMDAMDVNASAQRSEFDQAPQPTPF